MLPAGPKRLRNLSMASPRACKWQHMKEEHHAMSIEQVEQGLACTCSVLGFDCNQTTFQTSKATINIWRWKGLKAFLL